MMKYNYSAGPARIAPSVITKANESIIHYEDSGMSILEISHRSNEYKKIMEELKINLTSLLSELTLIWLDSDLMEELQLDKSIEATKTDIAKIVFLGDFFIIFKWFWSVKKHPYAAKNLSRILHLQINS